MTTVTNVNVMKEDCQSSVGIFVSPAVTANNMITRTRLTSNRGCVLNLQDQGNKKSYLVDVEYTHKINVHQL